VLPENLFNSTNSSELLPSVETHAVAKFEGLQLRAGCAFFCHSDPIVRLALLGTAAVQY